MKQRTVVNPRAATMPVILFAASAGGIDALSKIVSALPPDFPAPVVIVQHRTPGHPTALVAILSRVSSLPVKEAHAGQVMTPATIHVARPDMHLTIDRSGRFRYMDGRRIRHVRSSANPLFSSSAETFGSRAIAVVLTGTGMDATDGVQAIKASGGTVIAQDRQTSRFFGMPGSAIGTGAVDHVIALSDIAPTIVRLVNEQLSKET